MPIQEDTYHFEVVEGHHVSRSSLPVRASQKQKCNVEEKEDTEENDVGSESANEIHEDHQRHEEQEESFDVLAVRFAS